MLTPRARGLGAALRDARLEAHYGLRELSRRVGVNPALVSNWELGQRVPNPEDVAGILGALGVTGEKKAWIMSLARGAAGPGWFTPGPQGSPTHFTTLVAHERAARSMTVWAPLMIPDLLQIPDYAGFACSTELADASALQENVDKRMQRKGVLFGAKVIRADMFIAVEALRNHFGDDDVMLRQLRFITDVMVMSRTITVRVVPSEAASTSVLGGAFTLCRMKDRSSVVYCPHHGVGVFLVDEQAAPYLEVMDRLAKMALSPAKSLHRLEAEADQLVRALEAQRQANDASLVEILAGEERAD
ncbi:helix-turn-helix domain-containing protein [Amycolatopsis sp. cg13]|uniref:helix-turn-helix domain-containing protein n=1 Tax=Amycolatopsis sp. cg13 TaxID=3238807 RepID=UPI0035241803